MKGWLIFRHSFLMVCRNWFQAVQIGLIPVALILAVAFLVLRGSALELMATSDPEQMGQLLLQPGFSGKLLVVWLFAVLTMLSVIVNWHRFVLLEEYPQSWIPSFHFGAVLGYLGRSIMLVIIGLLLAIPVGMVAALFMAIPVVGVVVMLGLYLLVAVAMYRVIVILPAAAIGKPIGLSEAFQATEDSTADILVLMLVSFGVNILFQLVVWAISLISATLGFAVSFPVSLGLALVNVSVLTTFYGHYVEGRSID
ncbi:hypothetical protein J7443_01105 [Tropicibacter sp. R15_0]|uniref:hypothetical protein n=1 Tax=Tropicibacter sp. R15_0 TaxID=2821101 RepID=UPI001ADD4AC4|nr:hypothetical protein [Tropicibacter sp. R15_0]MBO9463814.1 hypothetical protein [Tropicibacter sp. R15_0]